MTPTPRHWTDQPEILDQAEIIVGRIPVADAHGIEVRKLGVRWFVTHGNLFGSQTVECDSPVTVLRLIETAMRRRSGAEPVDPPKGVTLMKNARERAA